MPANSILICAPTTELRENIERTLRNAGYATTSVISPAAAVASLSEGPIDLVVAEGLAVSGELGWLRTAAAQSATPVMVVSPAGDLEAKIAFMEAGADDVIAAGFAPRELEGRVEALLIHSGRLRVVERDGAERDGAERNGPAAGQLMTFFSPKGGVGTTTLAVNTAVLLADAGGAAASVAGPRVLLIDLDLQFGQVATHLNLEQRLNIARLVADDQAMNDPEVAASYVLHHQSGVSVLASPTTPDAEARIGVDDVEQIVALFRPTYDHIVIDAGSNLDPRAIWALDHADSDVLVIFPELAALRATSVLLAYLGEVHAIHAKTHFVVNHVFARELLTTRDIEHLLPQAPAAEIPFTEIDMIRAVDEGVPVVLGRPRSPASIALRQLAGVLLGIQTEPKERARQRRGFRFGRG